MATIIAQLDRVFRAAIAAALDVQADAHIGVSQNPQFGDYQSNAAMGLVKILAEKTGGKPNPRAIAEQIKAKLDLGEMAAEVTIAGPGFINIKLSRTWVDRQLESLKSDPRLGVEQATKSQTIVIDYSGPNIAKEMHVGHLRSTIIGDAISRVVEFQGNQVIRQNHIGDWGTQFGMLIEYGIRKDLFNVSTLAAAVEYGQPPATLDVKGPTGGVLFPISDLEQFYRDSKKMWDEDPKFQAAARRRVVNLQAGYSVELTIWSHIVKETQKHYRAIYERLGIRLRPDDDRGESSYNGMLSAVVKELCAPHPPNPPVAEESQGATVINVPGYEAPLIVKKSDGGYLYGTTDLAAIRFRVLELHANRIIYVHDSRQAQHFTQLFWAAKKAGWVDGVELDYAPFGTMLGEDGTPFKTRSGGTIKLKDLLSEAEQRALAVVTEKNLELSEARRKAIAHAVGIGAVKYSDLAKDRVADYVFSFDKMLALDGNTAPYLQYAHARIRSIFRKAKEPIGRVALQSPFELALAKHILRLPEIVELVGRELKPHYLCTYLYDLSTRFSGFYENCPVLQSEEPVRGSRLALCDLAARTLEIGLNLLGVEHPDQM